MSLYFHTTVNAVVATDPCKLLSIILSQEATGTGTVRVYDEQSAQSPQLVLELYVANDDSKQFRFEGLEMQRGIYVEIYSGVDHVTVEWEPIPKSIE